jgi:hypothetical protein
VQRCLAPVLDYALIRHNNHGLAGQQQQEILQFAAILLAAMHHGFFGDTSTLGDRRGNRWQQSKDAAAFAWITLHSNNSSAGAASGG